MPCTICNTPNPLEKGKPTMLYCKKCRKVVVYKPYDAVHDLKKYLE